MNPLRYLRIAPIRRITGLNTAGYCDGLAFRLRRIEADEFLAVHLAELVFLADEHAVALGQLEASAGR